MGTGRRKALLAGGALAVGMGAVGGIAFAHGNSERLRADLAGGNEVSPADPDGDGRAVVDIDPATGQICFRVKFSETGTPNRGHIHVGVAGNNGDIVVPLFELVGTPADPRNDELEKRELRGCVAADPALAQQIANNPAGYYVNLHNSRFPGGAIRGQLD